MITKSRIFGLLVILGVGLLVLRDEDETSQTRSQGTDTESATERQLQPQEPSFLTPRRDYGIAEWSSPKRPTAPYGKGGLPTGESDFPTYPNRYRDPVAYSAQDELRTGGYRFRPLSERERARMQAAYPQYAYPGRYAPPYSPPNLSYPSGQPYREPAVSPPHFAQRVYPEQPAQTYNFRPLEKSPGARSRWQGPYGQPDPRFDPFPWDPSYPMAPWTTDPQWGSTPPSQRMYPDLGSDPGRRLTAR